MNAIELFLKDGKSAGVYYCEKCKIVNNSKEFSDQCCQNYLCKQCGKDTGSRFQLICNTCYNVKRIQGERVRFEKAEKVTEWSGPVYCEGVGYNEGYASCVDDLLDDVEPEDMPKYVWTCDSRPTCDLDYYDIIENATQDAHEDFDSGTLEGEDELKSAIEKFNELNKGSVTWEPNYKKALLTTVKKAE